MPLVVGLLVCACNSRRVPMADERVGADVVLPGEGASGGVDGTCVGCDTGDEVGAAVGRRDGARVPRLCHCARRCAHDSCAIALNSLNERPLSSTRGVW